MLTLALICGTIAGVLLYMLTPVDPLAALFVGLVVGLVALLLMALVEGVDDDDSPP